MKHRLLIVDDEERILDAMSDYFDFRGFDVACAADLAAAERLVDEQRFSAAIADLRLTGVERNEGLDVIRYIRAKAPETKVIVLTAYGTPQIVEIARSLGADAILEKPQPLAAIADTVIHLLGG